MNLSEANEWLIYFQKLESTITSGQVERGVESIRNMQASLKGAIRKMTEAPHDPS